MNRIKRLISLVFVTTLTASSAVVLAQAPDVAEPFKLGTFSIAGSPTVGLVLRDALIVDIGEANAAIVQSGDLADMTTPADMLGVIAQYEDGVRDRLYAIVDYLVEGDRLEGNRRPAYVHDVETVGFLPPVLYPSTIMNAAVNFYTHACEGCSDEELAQMTRERQQNRGVPYLFLKPTRGSIIGNNDEIVIPYGRDRTDWEVELGTVIGREAKYVSAARAEDYVFGYMVSIDVSDRGGRPPGGAAFGTDWFVGKGHDTFAPQGPWIVPKEFYGDPMERLHQLLTIDGVTVQEARAGDMIHSLWELIEYSSSLITLYPGDVLNSGTSGGTSTGAFETGTRSGYLEPGEEIAASIEGIGTLRHTVVAGEPPPADLTGAQLPPVESYLERE
ncbi:MAG TPA: fumarylacetoacetate hydrolase family protein [Gammaproteobacteria bacterium]|nr:fumarylacetoacetate hydrolase family protein [Gammaproteobacteria bacterium]